MKKNKAIKVFYMEKRLKDIYPYATKWQMFKFRVRTLVRRSLITAGVLGIAAGLVYSGAYFNPVTTYAVQVQEKIVEVVKPEAAAAVMDRIAGCESQGSAKSKGSHIAKNGQVVVHANANQTVDVGIFQLNVNVWGKKATELGYNIFTEQGNKDMAYWIYKNVGTGPWYSSENCWK